MSDHGTVLASVTITEHDLADTGQPGFTDTAAFREVRKRVEEAMTRAGFEALTDYGFIMEADNVD